MRAMLPKRPSAGLVVALLALFVALGGTAAAKLIINGSNVRDGSLTGADIKDRSIGGAKIKNDSLTGTQIKESSLGTVPNAQNAEALGGKAAAAYAPARWALIAGTPSGAHILAQSGNLTVDRFAAGFYLVGTGGSVAGLPLSATLNIASAGFISVAPCGGTVNNPGGIDCPLFNDSSHVLVRTLSTPPVNSVDSTFYLVIGG